MKNIALTLILFFIVGSSFEQTTAVTNNGEEVILYSDGPWKFANKEDSIKREIRTNSTHFIKPADAVFQVKSNIIPMSVYINSKKWIFKKSTEAEYEFETRQKGKDIYGLFLSERVEVPIENLKEIALQNAKKVSPDVKAVSEEYRNVNNIKVLCMRMDGTLQGIKFSYLGYYYSCEKGSLQFLTYTAQNLFKEYQPDMQDLLDGLVLQANDSDKASTKTQLSK